MFVIHLRTVKLVVVDISCFIDNYTNKTRTMTKTRKIKQNNNNKPTFHLDVGFMKYKFIC